MARNDTRNVRSFAPIPLVAVLFMVLLIVPLSATAQPEGNRIIFVLGTDENWDSLYNASASTTIEVEIYNASQAELKDFSNETVVFLASLDNETVSSINQTINGSAHVFVYNLSSEIDIGNVVDAESGNITALANTTSDENGNYTFTNLPAGDYVINVAYYTPAMGGKWFTGRTYTSVGDGEDRSDVEVCLTFGSEADANNIRNAIIDSSSPPGTSTISGQTLAHKMGGEVVAMTNATVIISSYLKGDLNCDDRLTPADALIALQMAAGNCEPDIAGDMNFDGVVTSLDALMILQAA